MTVLLTLVAIFGGFSALIYFSFVRPFIAVRASPASDVTLIKARMGGEGHRVLEITRDGNDWLIERGGAKTWRKYSVVIQYPDGSRVVRIVGVSTTVVFAPYLVTYEGGSRQPLWTHHQASLP